MLVAGRIPQVFDLAERWHEAPRWQAFTVADFCDFCHYLGFGILEEIYLSRSRRLQSLRYKNLRATTAVFAVAAPLGRRVTFSCVLMAGTRSSPPVLQHKAYDRPSQFVPENLLREARRQMGLPEGQVPSICVLDPDGDIVASLLDRG